MDFLKHIWAKKEPRETLVEHTNDVLGTWKSLKEQYETQLQQDNVFWELSYLSCLFHDSGKIALNFQDFIHDRKGMSDNYIRHEFVSGMLFYAIYKEAIENCPLPAIAVFGHHKPFQEELFSERERCATLRLFKEDFDLLLDFLKEQSQHLTLQGNYANNEIEQIRNTTNLAALYDKFYQVFMLDLPVELTSKDRKTFVFYKAILNTSDWCASGHRDLRDKVQLTEVLLRARTIEKLRSEGKHEIADTFGWLPFQIECLKKKEDVLAIAPTGSGKTEAALLWATNKMPDEKIIYLLPTRVTSNAIYERLQKYFGEKHTAVIHSSAFYYRKEKNDNFHKGEYLVDKTFFRAVNICTIDQVLTQGFNIGYWELKTFHCRNAWIVIDEIHLYAPYTLGLVVSSIQYLRKEYGARFFIMTATMPAKLQSLLKKALQISNDDQVVKDQYLLQEKRNYFEARSTDIEGVDQEIQESLRRKKKVLIVVNTVDSAILAYRKYAKLADTAICYHSRFIQKDRIKKESAILDLEEHYKSGTSLLLVATQVVEVCLDIDYDILFTENAPMDALVQRAGRVNRKRKKPFATKVIVFKEQEATRKNIYTEVPQVLDRTFTLLSKLPKDKKLSESDLISLVDQVYENYEVERTEGFREGLRKYREAQRAYHYVKDILASEKLLTREGLDTVNVIPVKFHEELIGKSPMEKAKFELSVRRWKFKKYKAKEEDKDYDWFNYIDTTIQYDEDVGLVFPEKAAKKNTTVLRLRII